MSFKNYPPFFLPGLQLGIGIVPSQLDYSETEQQTAVKWIDGKDIYQKTINFGAIPNNTTKTVAHSITTIEELIFIEGYAENAEGGDNRWIKLSFINTSSQFMRVSCGLTNLVVKSVGDLSIFEECYMTLFYTKV